MKIRIEAESGQICGTKIFLDDVEQTDITQIAFVHTVRKPCYLRLDRFAMEDGKYVIDGGHLKRMLQEFGKEPQ